MPNIRMLVVEDDTDIGLALKEYFEIQGFEATLATDGEQALEEMKKKPPYDVVLLDVMLPKKTGFDVLRESQELGIESPVLMITGRGEQENILKGFGLGAADYITKPFNVDELASRVKAVLSRTLPPSQAPMDIYVIGDVKVNFSTHEVTKNGDPLHFTVMEFDLLRYLLENRGKTVTRRQLVSAGGGLDPDIATRTIDRHMASLRQKLEADPSNPVYIQTVYGQGYRFNI